MVTFYRWSFMKRRFLSENERKDRVRSAGLSHVDSIELAFPGSRLFVAQRLTAASGRTCDAARFLPHGTRADR